MKMQPLFLGFVLGVALACVGPASFLAGQQPTATQPVEATDAPDAVDPPSATDPPAATDPAAPIELEEGATPPSATAPSETTPEPDPTVADRAEQAGETVENALEGANQQVEQVAEQVDQNETAKQVSAGLLEPIYRLSENMAFPWFYWLAFAAMATGVVSYALQLVLGKLIVLTRMGFSMSEILSDALGFVISLVGLVLTTQAATENSTFATSSFSVLSAAIVGLVAGIIFYLWGQSQELAAARGRSVDQAVERAKRS